MRSAIIKVCTYCQTNIHVVKLNQISVNTQIRLETGLRNPPQDVDCAQIEFGLVSNEEGVNSWSGF